MVKYLFYLFLVCILFSFITGCNKPDGEDANKNISTIQYEQSLDIFPNPERGFMHFAEVHSEGNNLNLVWLKSQKDFNITLVHRFYYLENFKEQAISENQLQLIITDMNILREAGMKCILRFGYTDDMSGTDASLAVIKQHLDQLQPVFEQNKDVIAFMQAGFIGAWGEWHSSSNGLATIENEREFLYKLLSVLPVEIMVQVRTPGAKQQIVESIAPLDASIAYTGDYSARIGHHNDCFLAGGTDYGTYSNIEADKYYISQEALFVPTGGETCPPVGEYPGCITGQNEMKLLKWTYLNLDWYQPVLNVWRNAGCFNEFQRNLGYRLVLVNAKFPKQVTEGLDYIFEFSLTNKGYAPLYNYKITNLVFKNTTSGTNYRIELPVDIRDCKPNGLLTINKLLKLTGIPQGDYDLYLEITDQSESLKNRIEYMIRLANTDTWDQTSGLNNLKHQLKIAAK